MDNSAEIVRLLKKILRTLESIETTLSSIDYNTGK